MNKIKGKLKAISNKEKNEIENVKNIKELRKQYEYIYDHVCMELDYIFKKNNYCDFQNDKCICQREAKNCAHENMGCCYTYRNSRITGFPVDTKLCEFLVNGKCIQNCISCKLFTCSYLKRKNVKFKPNDFILIKVFFNRKQKSYIQDAFFKSKVEILNELIRLKK